MGSSQSGDVRRHHGPECSTKAAGTAQPGWGHLPEIPQPAALSRADFGVSVAFTAACVSAVLFIFVAGGTWTSPGSHKLLCQAELCVTSGHMNKEKVPVPQTIELWPPQR